MPRLGPVILDRLCHRLGPDVPAVDTIFIVDHAADQLESLPLPVGRVRVLQRQTRPLAGSFAKTVPPFSLSLGRSCPGRERLEYHFDLLLALRVIREEKLDVIE